MQKTPFSDETLKALETLKEQHFADIESINRTQLVELAVQYFVTVPENKQKNFIAKLKKW